MKKTEVYVPIANKKEAKQAKAVLKALGEDTFGSFIDNKYYDTGGLYFNAEFREWAIAISFGGVNPNQRKQITLKQLVELLVKVESDKIAVRVDNEKEFNALMKYYKSINISLGTNKGRNWGSWTGKPLCIQFHDNGATMYEEFAITDIEFKDYKIIPFSDFAKDKGIKLPVFQTNDGVDIYEMDNFWWVQKVNGECQRPVESCLRSHKPDMDLITFSTKQSALDWIEAQKPKKLEIKLNCDKHLAIIDKDWVMLRTGSAESNTTVYYKHSDIEAIHKAMKELS